MPTTEKKVLRIHAKICILVAVYIVAIPSHLISRSSHFSGGASRTNRASGLSTVVASAVLTAL